MTFDRTTFLAEMREELAEKARGGVDLQELLERILDNLDAVVGTIHGVEKSSGELIMLASIGMPAELSEKVQRIPPGKGLAGLAAQRRAPVDVCNLQTDQSGQAKPAAKSTGVAGSIAIPMLVGGELRGVLGVALAEPHEFDDSEKQFLLELAAVTGAVVA
jgi:L-methionine (R)-S-oxide reductase